MSRRLLHTAAVSAVLTATIVSPFATAAGFSWFDDSPARDSLGQLLPPSTLFDRDKRLTFGVEAYKSLRDDAANTGTPSNGSLTVYGEFAKQDDFYVPLATLNGGLNESLELDSPSGRLSGFGVKWRHRLDASNTLSVAAGYRESPVLSPMLPNIEGFDTRASLSWMGTFDGNWRPGVTGSVFVGDNAARDESYRRLGRSYYGFSVGGQLQLAQAHTPYFSYRLQRSYFSNEDLELAMPYEQRSQVAAGWIWQVQRNWSMQAEASYGLNGASLDADSPERSRIFFGTRFDFR